MTQLILKRAPIGDNLEDYSVLEAGAVVGRIFLSPAAPLEGPWMWASGHNGDYQRAAPAMQAFARSWHRERTRLRLDGDR